MVEWILNSPLNKLVVGQAWVFPVLETTHFFGLCLLLGGLLFLDLRLMGLFRGFSFEATHELLLLVFIGFGANLITGVLFFFGDPERYSINIGFQIKMVLVLIMGMNAAWFFWKLNGPMKNWDAHADAPLDAKIVGCISLVGWFAVMILGRLIPYVGTG